MGLFSKFKAGLQRTKEKLSHADLTHAHLVLRQARLEFIRYPIPETQEQIA